MSIEAEKIVYNVFILGIWIGVVVGVIIGIIVTVLFY